MSLLFLPKTWASAAILAALLVAPAQAMSLQATGDGSATDNPALLRGGVGICPDCVSPGLDHALVLRESRPPFDIDWSLGLRGGYVQSTNASGFEGALVPRVTLTGEGLRTSYTVTGDAEIVSTSANPLRLAALRLGIAADYEFDALTTLSALGDLSLTQADPASPGSVAGAVANPQVIDGDGTLAVTRDLGFADLQLRGTAGRSVYGPTELGGGVTVDNSFQNNTRVGGGLRVSRAITPILSLFADATAGYQYFDAPSPALLVKLDGPTYTLRGGVAAQWTSVLEAETSVGVGLRRFDAGLPDVTATLYDAKLIFRPDETLTLEGVFGTSFSPPGSNGGSTRLGYTLDADATYRVNPWLALRASAGWYYTDIVGTGTSESGYGVGLGADYTVAENVLLNADYTFGHAEVLPAAPVDTHKVMVGVTFSK